MSGHRRVKDVAYEEEEYDEYNDEGYQEEEPQGWSAEDEENLRQGAITVRQKLGSDIGPSEKEIKEAIWYYYYDLDQTVAYLKQKHAPRAPKKPKLPSRFDEAAKSAQNKIVNNGPALPSNFLEPVYRKVCLQPLSMADFFKDTPWFNVPPHRLGNIIVEPFYPRGGLLGGSSAKPSKLAALAAARKKAQETKQKSSDRGVQDTDGSPVDIARSVALLDRLGNGSNNQMHVFDMKSLSMQPSKASKHVQVGESRQTSDLQREKISQEREQLGPPEPIPTPPGPDLLDPKPDNFRAAPSSFAKIMMGHQSLQTAEHMTEGNLFSLLHPRSDDPTNNPFIGLSPDDIVINAQAKGASQKSTAASKNSNASTAAVTNGMSAVKLEDVTKAKSKHLDVVGEFRKLNAKNAANFVVIGHVDHGKSTLMGRLLYDLKLVSQRSVDKLRAEATTIGKSSFALAWLMDSTSEERQRGITVDIATNNFETDKTRFTILDAPGHRDFIPNMIAGASQADFAVLVIDASVNAFEAGLRGQTKEHALLVRSMGIVRVIVAVNKMDAAHWSEDRFTEISQQMTAFFLAAGFQPKNIAFVPCAGLTGENVVTKLPEDVAPWYHGHTLVEELEASESGTRALTSPLRLTVSDIFRGGVQNPLSISGRVDAGFLQIGDVILAMPATETATIKGIDVDGAPADWAVAGQIPTLHLSDIDPIHLRHGDIMCSPTNHPIRNVKAFVAKILAFEHVTPGWVDVHKGRLHTPARVTQLLAGLEKSSGAVEKKRPRVVKPGSVARVRVELDKALPLEADGRVVLRSEGATLAAGLIEGIEL